MQNACQQPPFACRRKMRMSTLVSHLFARITGLRPGPDKVSHKSNGSEFRGTFSWPMQQQTEFSVGTTQLRKTSTALAGHVLLVALFRKSISAQTESRAGCLESWRH